MEEKLLFREECYTITGICMKVHSKLGKGFKEIVYKDAIELELIRHSIPYEREKRFQVIYEGSILKHGFDADFYVYEGLILEIKAVSQLLPDSFRQTLNYLKVSQIKLGLLINFGTDRLAFQRIVCSY
jgi:GxxExxY protein